MLQGCPAAICVATMTYLAVPISAEGLDAAGRQIEAALAAGAEMLELRTDYLQQLSGDSVRSLILRVRQTSGARTVIVTCRDPQRAALGLILRRRAGNPPHSP